MDTGNIAVTVFQTTAKCSDRSSQEVRWFSSLGFKGSLMTLAVQQILRELKERLSQLYGARLRGLYLFGSHARNEADDESDVDVLIVLDRVDDYSEEIRRTSEVMSDASLKYGVTLSRYFSSEARWQEDTTLFYLNVREEAIPA